MDKNVQTLALSDNIIFSDENDMYDWKKCKAHLVFLHGNLYDQNDSK